MLIGVNGIRHYLEYLGSFKPNWLRITATYDHYRIICINIAPIIWPN